MIQVHKKAVKMLKRLRPGRNMVRKEKESIKRNQRTRPS
jgi:hypothetical protein